MKLKKTQPYFLGLSICDGIAGPLRRAATGYFFSRLNSKGAALFYPD